MVHLPTPMFIMVLHLLTLLGGILVVFLHQWRYFESFLFRGKEFKRTEIRILGPAGSLATLEKSADKEITPTEIVGVNEKFRLGFVESSGFFDDIPWQRWERMRARCLRQKYADEEIHGQHGNPDILEYNGYYTKIVY